ncbi:MAG: DUF4143 domain-containing protein [Desulfovermiculus sp.]|nr:DUF4143 domain-containing protein [Desulfovermiculus sp.]
MVFWILQQIHWPEESLSNLCRLHAGAKRWGRPLTASCTKRLILFRSRRQIAACNKTYFVDNGIITSLNIPVGHGPPLESFVIAEIEKHRKLGFIPTDLLYYYKSASGHEIDLLFQVDDMLYAIEIKSTQRPGKKDIANLKQFNPKQDISVTRILLA